MMTLFVLVTCNLMKQLIEITIYRVFVYNHSMCLFYFVLFILTKPIFYLDTCPSSITKVVYLLATILSVLL